MLEPIVDITAEIPLHDLEFLRATLNAAYNHSFVVDLAEQYRKLSQSPGQSNLSKALQNALTLVVTYMDEAQVTQETPDEEPVSE